jgi:TRAP-type C4-dicarboxylate transport system permease small subunit
MTEQVLRIVGALLSVLRMLAGVLLVASVLLNFANVVGRYFFGVSIDWAEEIILFLMVGCVFFGHGVVAWHGRYIRMDVLVGMMPEKVREALHLFSELVFIAAALTVVAFAMPVIIDLWNFDQRSQAANFPLVIPQSMIPIGLTIMALLVALRLITGGERDAAGDGPGH